MGFKIAFCHAILISPIYSDRNSPCCRFKNRHSHPGKFLPIRSLSRLLRTVASKAILPSDVRTNSFQLQPRGLVFVSHNFGQRDRGRRIQTIGHSNSGSLNNSGASFILTWVSTVTASIACPAHLRSLEKHLQEFCRRHLRR